MATITRRPPFTGRRYTVDEVDALFATSFLRVELLDGHLLVSPSATSWHQTLGFRLAQALASYVHPLQLGRVFNPGTIVVPPGLEFQPDVLVTQWSLRIRPWREYTAWWLVVEVLSPSNRDVDFGSKRSCYLELGVRELWLVDPDAPRVTVVRPDAPDTHIEPPATLVWQPSPTIAPLVIDLGTLFADA
jgi:Uma2 family endonuclease